MAYSYPPRGGVGSHRAVRLARGLAERGWRVSILTAAAGPTVLPACPSEGQWPGVEVIEAPYRDRTAFFTHALRLGRSARSAQDPPGATPSPPSNRSAFWLAARALLLFPDEHVGWIRGATSAGLDRLRRGDIGAIISTSPPESAHIAAARLRRRTLLPWIADFRDPWSFSHMRAPGPTDRLHRLWEARTLRFADALVTVTRPWAERFRWLYPSLRTEIIPNGFDESSPAETVRRHSNQFRLVYTGKLDPGRQPSDTFFAGVAAAATAINLERVRVVLHCYGTPEQPVREQAVQCGLASAYEWAGPLSSAQSREAQRTADVLVVLGWNSDAGWIPAKLFDYLGSERRVLYVGRLDSEAASILRATGRGICVDSVESCRDTIVQWYREWAQKGFLRPGGDPEAVERYAFRHCVEKYDRLLSELVSSSP